MKHIKPVSKASTEMKPSDILNMILGVLAILGPFLGQLLDKAVTQPAS